MKLLFRFLCVWYFHMLVACDFFITLQFFFFFNFFYFPVRKDFGMSPICDVNPGFLF